MFRSPRRSPHRLKLSKFLQSARIFQGEILIPISKSEGKPEIAAYEVFWDVILSPLERLLIFARSKCQPPFGYSLLLRATNIL